MQKAGGTRSGSKSLLSWESRILARGKLSEIGKGSQRKKAIPEVTGVELAAREVQNSVESMVGSVVGMFLKALGKDDGVDLSKLVENAFFNAIYEQRGEFQQAKIKKVTRHSEILYIAKISYTSDEGNIVCTEQLYVYQKKEKWYVCIPLEMLPDNLSKQCKEFRREYLGNEDSEDNEDLIFDLED